MIKVVCLCGILSVSDSHAIETEQGKLYALFKRVYVTKQPLPLLT